MKPFSFPGLKPNEINAKMDALEKSLAVIEFDLNGTVQNANENFLNVTGYTLQDIKGKNHSIFLDPAERDTMQYKVFWDALRRGQHQSGEFKRKDRNGRDLWLQASYNPVLDLSRQPFKVVKYATDITSEKIRNVNYTGQIEAINKSQAVIEFNMDGTIIDANQNFLDTLGYSRSEIVGKHHSMFVDPNERESPEYRQFWAALNRGEYQTAEYKRIGKNGKEVWIQASYNPIMDLNDKPYKVVKYASDTTKQAKFLQNVKALISDVDAAITKANEQSAASASASTLTSENVRAVAAGAEELSASVQEIAESMMKSKAAVDDAFDQTEIADQSTQRLTEAARSMGGVVSLIQNIASQINLLALNATIESARAGEAGKGFAIVASEIKNLSRQTTEATEQIAGEIKGMQAVSNDVVTALDVIKEKISAVRTYVTGTASAVEEQSAVAQEISNNMHVVSGAVCSINDSIGAISSAIKAADTSMDLTRQTVRTLASR